MEADIPPTAGMVVLVLKVMEGGGGALPPFGFATTTQDLYKQLHVQLLNTHLASTMMHATREGPLFFFPCRVPWAPAKLSFPGAARKKPPRPRREKSQAARRGAFFLPPPPPVRPVNTPRPTTDPRPE